MRQQQDDASERRKQLERQEHEAAMAATVSGQNDSVGADASQSCL